MDFFLGQEFSGLYPPDAATWCTENGYVIKDNGDGTYVISEVPDEVSGKDYDIESVTADHVYDMARSKGYDSPEACVSYLNSTNHVWKAEATKFNVWRDRVWDRCHAMLRDIESGAIDKPDIDSYIRSLPKLSW